MSPRLLTFHPLLDRGGEQGNWSQPIHLSLSFVTDHKCQSGSDSRSFIGGCELIRCGVESFLIVVGKEVISGAFVDRPWSGREVGIHCTNCTAAAAGGVDPPCVESLI